MIPNSSVFHSEQLSSSNFPLQPHVIIAHLLKLTLLQKNVFINRFQLYRNRIPR
jgi:hypothetical protein